MLRPVVDTDLPTFFEHQQDPGAVAMAAAPTRKWDAFLLHWQDILADPAKEARTILIDGRVVGYVASWEHVGRRLVGYWIGREFWGRGIATAALREFLESHELRRPVHAYVALSNIGSIRVLEKCGFQRAGEPETGEDGVTELRFVLERGEAEGLRR